MNINTLIDTYKTLYDIPLEKDKECPKANLSPKFKFNITDEEVTTTPENELNF